MIISTITSWALLSALISAQTPPMNETVVGGFPTTRFALEYYRASHTTNVTNVVSFPGYDWTRRLGPSYSPGRDTTNSSDTWQMHLNYSRVTVPTYNGNATTGLTALSITFPEEQWSSSSEWSLCVNSVVLSPTISTSGTGGSNESSCFPFLGESCVAALLREYRKVPAPRTGNGCPTMPSFSDVDECKSYSSQVVGGLGTAAVENTTSPDLVYNSTQYVNVTGDGQTYLHSNVTYQGLSSGQAFASFLSVLPNDNLDAESQAESRKVQVIGMSLIPSLSYRKNETTGFIYEPNTRLVCLRPNTNTNTNIGSGSGSGNNTVSGASTTLEGASKAVLAFLAVTIGCLGLSW